MSDKPAVGSETLIWNKTRRVISAMSTRDVHKLVRLARRELSARHQEAEAYTERVVGARLAMANFMAGVTWALACRTALRESKGHDPVGGKRPAAGDMWLPREMLTAVRHQVKDRGWHPLSARSATEVIDNLKSEDFWSQPVAVDVEASDRTPALGGALQVAKFVGRYAGATAAVVLDDRFDVGGEA
jgi:hypothetical protein